MGLLDLVTGGKSSDATSALKQGLDAIRAVRTPTVDDLKFQIEKLVQTGQITPVQAQTYLQNPSAFLSENISQTGTQAEEKSIGELLSAADQGGLNPIEQAKIAGIIQQLGTQEKGANDAVVQRQAERGALTGGETMAAQLSNNQSADVNANELARGTAADAYQQMLNELTSAGTMGATLQGQQNEQANTVAAATDAINRFNAAEQQQETNFNTTNKNEAQAENTRTGQAIEAANVGNENEHALQQSQLQQQVFNDEMQKAAAEAGVSENEANLDTTQGGQEAGLIGGLIGAGGEAATAGMTKAPVYNINGTPGHSEGGEIHDYLKGGVVDGKARLPGNSPLNDTVPARLSPGEIVLPRTVASNPQPDRVMAFLNRIRKPRPTPHPDDVATVLHAMGKVRGNV